MCEGRRECEEAMCEGEGGMKNCIEDISEQIWISVLTRNVQIGRF